MRKLQVLGVLSVLAALVSAPAVAQDRVVCRVGGVSGPCPGDASVPGTMYASNFLTTGGPLDVNISKVGGTAIGLTVPVSGSVLTSIDATLTLLNAKFGALGQQLAAASAPVVLPAAQVALLAQSAQFPAALVSGRLDVNLGASSITLPVSAATLPLPTNAATETTLAGLHYTQGSTTSGQSGPLAQGAVTTNAPTYTTGQTAPFSLTTGGALRVTAIGTTVNPATVNITTRDLASTTTSGQNGQTIVTGTPTANSAATFALQGVSTIRPQITGTWTGTLTSELSMDGGTTYYPIGAHLTGTPLSTSTFTANGQGSVNVGSATHYRMRATAAMTGTAVITVAESAQVSTVNVANAIRLIDSTSGSTTQANIVAASTAVPTTATSIAVGLSPNSPTPRHNDTACSGTLTNGSPTLTCSSLNGVGSVGFHLAYGSTGSVSATCSYDGTNYDGAIPMTPSSAPATPVTSVSASGDWIFSAAGCKAVRFTLAGGTGSHTVTANISAIPAPAYATANQGAATTTAGAWPVKVTDGTNTAAVKAASTAAAAADPAAVVTQHPYSAAADSFTLISATTAATVVKNSPGVLRKVCVWIPSSGGSGGFYVYDNASAASGNAPVVMFTTTQNCFALDVRMANGITVQMTTAAATVGLYYN